MSQLSYNVTSQGIVVIIENRSYLIEKTSPNFHLVANAIQNEEWDDIPDLVNVEDALTNYIQAGVEDYDDCLAYVEDGEVYYDGEIVHDVISSRILEMMRDGFNCRPMLRFLENLMDNPSMNSRNQLYSFLEHKNLPITEDGCFLAYKTVRSDWYSHASGTLRLLQGECNEVGNIYNGVGEIIECSRSEVDDNPGNHCSKGLHVGAWSYAGHGGWYNNQGDHVVIVKVNPADAVSVPEDHQFQKLRVCKYEVVSESAGILETTVACSERPYDNSYTFFCKDDQVIFEYPDDFDGMEYRHGFVVDDSDQEDTHVTLMLGEEDTSFTTRTDVQYRQFIKSLMEHIEFI